MFIAALFTIAKTWKEPMCPRNDKENVVYVYSGILFSIKKEGNSAICNNMDETGRQYAK